MTQDENITEDPQTVSSRESDDDSDFQSVYANNTMLEPSVWDLKIIFGQLNQRLIAKPPIDWHTAVTLPWLHAKLFLYFLRINVALNEIQGGSIKVPSSVLPPRPKPPEGPDDNPHNRALYEEMAKTYTEMFGDQ